MTGGAHPSSKAVIDLYERHAADYARDRQPSLAIEQTWLDRFLDCVPEGEEVLDLGCGHGDPIARYVVGRGRRVHGIDASPTLVRMCRGKLPGETWDVRDMRGLDTGRRYAGILAWDSFFHLAHDDQRRMFEVFARHARPGTALLYTSGPAHGEAIGAYRGETLYHASLAPAEYRTLLGAHGFEILAHVAEDPACGGHTVWLARRKHIR